VVVTEPQYLSFLDVIAERFRDLLAAGHPAALALAHTESRLFGLPDDWQSNLNNLPLPRVPRPIYRFVAPVGLDDSPVPAVASPPLPPMSPSPLVYVPPRPPPPPLPCFANYPPPAETHSSTSNSPPALVPVYGGAACSSGGSSCSSKCHSGGGAPASRPDSRPSSRPSSQPSSAASTGGQSDSHPGSVVMDAVGGGSAGQASWPPSVVIVPESLGPSPEQVRGKEKELRTRGRNV